MKKYTKNILFLIILCIIIFYFVLKDDFNEIISLLINSNKLYILIAIFFVLLSDVFKSTSVLKLVKSLNFKYKFKNAFLLMLMTNFFNGITPFSLGGQPFELYILKKDNDIDYVSGSNILFRDFYTYQMALMILSCLSMILLYSSNVLVYSKLVENVLRVGFIINLIISLFLIYIPHSKKEEYKLIKFVILILFKFRIVKDKEKANKNINGFINKFKVQTEDAIKDKKNMFICILLNCFKLICVGVATYYSFKAIGSNVLLSKSIIIFILVMVSASFIPVPGASGGMEFVFMQLFSYYVIDSKLKAALLLWRFITYYLPMIYGSVILIFKRK